MNRWLRVTRNEMTLRHEAVCRWCGKTAWRVNDETLYYMPPEVVRRMPRGVWHPCQRIAPGRQLLHKGRKP